MSLQNKFRWSVVSAGMSLAMLLFLGFVALSPVLAVDVDVTGCVSQPEADNTDCSDTIDNDCDAIIDCFDSDCDSAPVCGGSSSTGIGIGSFCGDSSCNGVETCSTCPTDCGACPTCGDTVCGVGETCSTCSADCGACPPCGDGICSSPGEDCSVCATDCGTCPTPCGNGVTDPGEQCDDANASNADACLNSCFNNVCGDGFVRVGFEECDDGNSNNNDACSNACTIFDGCGDGNIDAGEQCDDGGVTNGDGCSAVCTNEPITCGNATCDGTETCGNCPLDCGPCASVCGNGFTEIGEECDDSNVLSGDGCNSVCLLEVGCGNGITEAGEECDDDNIVSGDGCSAICTVEDGCGDGNIDFGEQCDDNNLANGDGCSSLCVIENTCGNSICDGTESCSTCPGDCGVCPNCGNGTLDLPGEQCDDGNFVNGDGCNQFCAFEVPVNCGNGNVNPPEQCDDGNTVNNDACLVTCQSNICGDQYTYIGVEECDLGPLNGVVGAGCTASCQDENIPIGCGDGTVSGLESCDDANNSNNDNCLNNCTVAACGDGYLYLTIEECEDGNTTAGDGCDAVCNDENPFQFCGDNICNASETCASCEDDCGLCPPIFCGDNSCDPGENCSLCPGDCGVCPAGAFCGDGSVNQGSEFCDLGAENGQPNSGCTSGCQPQVAVEALCGNGLLEGNEACDDGNAVNTDTCSNNCQVLTPPLGPIGSIVEIITDFIDNPTVEQINNNVVVPGAIIAVLLNTFAASSLIDVFLYLRYLITEPLAFFTARRRKKWGIVYNAFTKEPVGLAIVRLYLLEAAVPMASTVTDLKGRFVFIVDPGKYTIRVAKEAYIYPSTYLRGQHADYRYADLYFGDAIAVTGDDANLSVNIPLDPVVKELPPLRVMIGYLIRRLNTILAFVGIILAIFSFVIVPSRLTAALLLLHMLLFLIFLRLGYRKRPRNWGIIYNEKNRKTLPRSIAKIYDAKTNRLLETTVTDGSGRYGFLVKNDQYYVQAEKNGYMQPVTPRIDLSNKKPDQYVAMDIGLRQHTESPVTPPTVTAPVVPPTPIAPVETPPAEVAAPPSDSLRSDHADHSENLNQEPHNNHPSTEQKTSENGLNETKKSIFD